MWGRHLVQNSLAAIAVALEFKVDRDVIRQALASFAGVKRRLEIIGEARGVSVMSDYGHHPTEIRATLRAIRECRPQGEGRVVTLFQPHRYSRTQMCWDEYLSAFAEADLVCLTDIYGASEKPIEGVSGESLCVALRHPNKEYVGSLERALEVLVPNLREGDFVVCLGAGSIGAIPERLLGALSADSKQIIVPETEIPIISAAGA
jgi:UDP-N-acetylmuramate--alanine ligase